MIDWRNVPDYFKDEHSIKIIPALPPLVNDGRVTSAEFVESLRKINECFPKPKVFIEGYGLQMLQKHLQEEELNCRRIVHKISVGAFLKHDN